MYSDQEHLPLRAFDLVILMLHGGTEGRMTTQEILRRLEGKVARAVVDLLFDTSPDGLGWSALRTMIPEYRMLDEHNPPVCDWVLESAEKRWRR